MCSRETAGLPEWNNGMNGGIVNVNANMNAAEGGTWSGIKNQILLNMARIFLAEAQSSQRKAQNIFRVKTKTS